MKKVIVAAAALALLLAGTVRWDLVAQTSKQAAAQGVDDTPENGQIAAKRQAMINAARRTYEAYADLHNAGTTRTIEHLYVWSSHLQSAQVKAATTKEQVFRACQDHLDRMKEVHDRVAALNRQGANGGEADQLHATEYCLAEAEVLLLEAKSSESNPRD